MIRHIAIILIIAASCGAIVGQASTRAQIKRIDDYARTLDNYARRNKNSNLVLADISDYGLEKPKWRKFASSKQFEKFRESTEVYEIANVLLRNGKCVLSVMTLSSPSGDWAKYLTLYFRPDGTLAKSGSELRTFYGDLVVRQQFHFNSKGRLLRRTRDYFDLATGKPKKPEEDYLRVQEGLVEQGNYYISTKSLPFSHLLKLR